MNRSTSTGVLDERRRLFTGLAVTGIGLAHFVFPARFDQINRLAFPERPRQFTYINGGIETVIGVTMTIPATRSASPVIGFVYASYLFGNIILARLGAGQAAAAGVI